jgi:hypothetical protein
MDSPSITGTHNSDSFVQFLKNQSIPDSYKISMFFAYLVMDEDDLEEFGVDPDYYFRDGFS